MAAIFGVVFFFGSEAADNSVRYFLRHNALSRMQDWARDISADFARQNRTQPAGAWPEWLKKHLMEEARHYNVTGFAITTASGMKITSGPPAGKHTGGKMHSGQASAASSSPAAPGSQTVTVAIPNARGKIIGHLRATLDQGELYDKLSGSIQNMIYMMLAAIALTISLAWFAYHQIRADANRRISRLSGEDTLTGLLNRQSFRRRFSGFLDGARANGHMLVYMHIDLDNFAKVTSTFGYNAADEVLRETARRLAAIAGNEAIVCRLDGDEFAIAARISSAAHALRLGEDIQKTLSKPVFWQDRCINPSASIGAVTFPHDGAAAARLERRAAMVCWAASNAGGNRLRFYDPGIEEKHRRNHELESLVEEAVKTNGFEMHFQPLVKLSSGALYGFEALIRMPGNDGELVNPDEFIQMAERLNLMEDLGAFALREGCRAAAQWPDHLRIAVNLSPSQFQSGNLAGLIREVLAETGLSPERLEAEVTENLMLDDSPFIMEQLKALKDMGVNIVLDDFGTGYSSLNYLWRFPFDKLKIDRSFVSAMKSSTQARSILRAIVLMARALDIPVTAEGIETEEQAAWLRKLRCATGQGYLFGKPVPATELAAMVLDDWRKHNGPAASANQDRREKRRA